MSLLEDFKSSQPDMKFSFINYYYYCVCVSMMGVWGWGTRHSEKVQRSETNFVELDLSFQVVTSLTNPVQVTFTH